MTYEEFLNIPVNALKDLETIISLKSQYCMEITAEEKEIREHMIRFYDEQTKSYELQKEKQKLEKLFTL